MVKNSNTNVIVLLIVLILGLTFSMWMQGKSEPGNETIGVVGITLKERQQIEMVVDKVEGYYYDWEHSRGVSDDTIQ